MCNLPSQLKVVLILNRRTSSLLLFGRQFYCSAQRCLLVLSESFFEPTACRPKQGAPRSYIKVCERQQDLQQVNRSRFRLAPHPPSSPHELHLYHFPSSSSWSLPPLSSVRFSSPALLSPHPVLTGWLVVLLVVARLPIFHALWSCQAPPPTPRLMPPTPLMPSRAPTGRALS